MASSITNADTLTLYGESFPSRVLLGTSRYPSLQSLSERPLGWLMGSSSPTRALRH